MLLPKRTKYQKYIMMQIKAIPYLMFLMLLTSCGSGTKTPNTSLPEPATESNLVQLNSAQVKSAGIISTKAEQKEMSSNLNVSGSVEPTPESISAISIPLGGYIKKTTLIPGMQVRKGQVLAILEDQAYILLQQDYLIAKNKLKFAEADYHRQKGLNSTKATSDKLFQQTENDYTHQKILLSSLAQQLRLIGLNPAVLNEQNISRSIPVYAPLDGYVTKVNVNTGKYVNATDVLFELVNPGKLRLNLSVLENDASNLKIGQKIVYTTNKNPKEKSTATIRLITPHIGYDRSTTVNCVLDDTDQNLIPGTYVNASIKTDLAKVMALPDDAIVKWENKFYVFSDEGNYQYRMIQIKPGLTNDGFTEVKSPLPAKKIVTKNAYALLMKMKNSSEEG